METRNYLDQKLSNRFHAFDSDKNGYIERSDFEELANQMSEAFGLKPNDAARTKLCDLYAKVWDHHLAAADKDGDGRLTEDEYKAACASSLLDKPEHFDQAYMPIINTIMDLADSDGDGRLSHAEANRWLTTSLKLPTNRATEISRRLDCNGDGYITRKEIQDAYRDYFFNKDPEKSVFNWFVGPLN